MLVKPVRTGKVVLSSPNRSSKYCRFERALSQACWGNGRDLRASHTLKTSTSRMLIWLDGYCQTLDTLQPKAHLLWLMRCGDEQDVSLGLCSALQLGRHVPSLQLQGP